MLQTEDLSLRQRAILGVVASFFCMAIPLSTVIMAHDMTMSISLLIVAGATIFAVLVLSAIIWFLLTSVAPHLSELLQAAASLNQRGRPSSSLQSPLTWRMLACDVRAARIALAQLEEKSAQTPQKNELAEAMMAVLTDLAAGKAPKEVEGFTASSDAACQKEFNRIVAVVREKVGVPAATAKSIEKHADDCIAVAGNMARQIETGVSAVSESAQILSDVDQRFTETSSVAVAAAERAQKARASVHEGHGVARDAVSAMERVKESATGIASVIEGVDKIAFQTRVLAMNAAIEASRAGEAGRGFSVVADLVNALAMRAEEEARSARQQLTATQNDILSAVGAVERMDVALEDISGHMDQMESSLSGITASKGTFTTSDARQALGSIDRILQQNAILAREMTASAGKIQDSLTDLHEVAVSGPVAAPAPATASAPAAMAPATVSSKPAIQKPVQPIAASKKPLAAVPAKTTAAPVAAKSGSATEGDPALEKKALEKKALEKKVVPLKPVAKPATVAPTAPVAKPKAVIPASKGAVAIAAALDDDWTDF